MRAGRGDAPGPGCITTALWTEGAVRFEAQVVRRLCRDAAALGYGALDAAECIRAMGALGRAAFGKGSGVLRFEARAGSAAGAGAADTKTGAVGSDVSGAAGSATGAKTGAAGPDISGADSENATGSATGAKTGAADSASAADVTGAVDAATGSAVLVGTTRPYQAPPARPEAARAAQRHPGPLPRPAFGAKVPRRELDRARAECSARGLFEVLLFDRAERLVEGSRSNVVVASRSGEWLFPEPALGAVRGVALDIARTRLPELRAAELTPHDLEQAREIVLLNAVIGALAVARYEGRSLVAPASLPGQGQGQTPEAGATGEEPTDHRGPLARALEAALRCGS